MLILIDTNVALDVLLERKPFYENAAKVMLLSEKEIIDGYVSSSVVTDIYYIIDRYFHDKVKTMDLIKRFIQTVHIASVAEAEIYRFGYCY